MSEQNEFAFARIRIAWSTTSYIRIHRNLCWRDTITISSSHSSNWWGFVFASLAFSSCELRGTIVIATILHPLPLRASRSRWHSYHLSSSMFDRRDTAKSTYIALQLQASEKSSNSSQEELTSVMRFAHNPACALVTDPRRPGPFAFLCACN